MNSHQTLKLKELANWNNTDVDKVDKCVTKTMNLFRNATYDEILNTCYESELNKRIKGLPHDALFMIALNLDYDTLISFCSSNKKMSKICEDSDFWQRRPDTLKYIVSSKNSKIPKPYQNAMKSAKRAQLFINSIYENLKIYNNAYFAVKTTKETALKVFLNEIVNKTEKDLFIKDLNGIVFEFENDGFSKKFKTKLTLFFSDGNAVSMTKLKYKPDNIKEFAVAFFAFVFYHNIDLYQLYTRNDCTREIKLNTKKVSQTLFPDCLDGYARKGPYSQIFDVVM